MRASRSHSRQKQYNAQQCQTHGRCCFEISYLALSSLPGRLKSVHNTAMAGNTSLHVSTPTQLRRRLLLFLPFQYLAQTELSMIKLASSSEQHQSRPSVVSQLHCKLRARRAAHTAGATTHLRWRCCCSSLAVGYAGSCLGSRCCLRSFVCCSCPLLALLLALSCAVCCMAHMPELPSGSHCR